LRVALLEPPATDPRSPHLAMASLHAALNLDGVEVMVIDAGAEGLDWLLNPGRLAASVETVQRGAAATDDPTASFLARIGPLVVDGAEAAGRVLRDPVAFYDAARCDEARELIGRAVMLHSVADGRHDYAIGPIRYQVAGVDPSRLADLEAVTADPSAGVFGAYFAHVAERVTGWQPDVVAVSILNHQQIVPGLTLARMLKAQGHVVVIGGTVYAKFVDPLRARPRFFELFCDAVCAYEGETAIRALVAEVADAAAGGRPLRLGHVPNLLWLDPATRTVRAGPVHSEDVAALPTPCFDGFDLGAYLVPEPVLPILTGKGCYFNHCKFCDIPFINRVAPRPYRRRRPEQVAQDMETLRRRHGARHFVITDEALAPRFLLQIADALRDHPDLDPRLVGYARFEAGFTGPVCRRLHDAGVRRLFFGLESGSQRMLDHMVKGVQVGTAHRVLSHCADAGIGVHLFSMIGLPTETEADARETLGFLLDEKDLLDHPRNTFDLHRFNLDLRTDYFEDAERYGLVVDRDALDRCDFPLDVPAWTPTIGLSHDDAGRLVSEYSAALQAELRRSRVFPAHVYPSFEEYSVLYADRFAASGGDWALRFALPPDDDPDRCTLSWCERLAVGRWGDGVLVSGMAGERALSAAAFGLLSPAPVAAPAGELLDQLLGRLGPALVADAAPQVRGELRLIIDDLLATGLLRLRVGDTETGRP
jgi:anaerobic magnesium-protoporphyrin IX monomethyl ester cyclase